MRRYLDGFLSNQAYNVASKENFQTVFPRGHVPLDVRLDFWGCYDGCFFE